MTREAALRRRDALLAKAASTTYPAEAEECRRLAGKLEARYGLEEPQPEPEPPPRAPRPHPGPPAGWEEEQRRRRRREPPWGGDTGAEGFTVWAQRNRARRVGQTVWEAPPMGPLSAIAVAGWFIIYGLTAVSGTISATPRGLGWCALVAAGLVLIDVWESPRGPLSGAAL